MKRGLFWIKVLRKLIIMRGRHGFFSGSVFSGERYSHQSPVTSFHTKKRFLAKVGPGYPLRSVPTILNTHANPKSKRYHCLSKEHHELGTRRLQARGSKRSFTFKPSHSLMQGRISKCEPVYTSPVWYFKWTICLIENKVFELYRNLWV